MMTTTTKKKNTKTTRRNIEIISAEEGRIKCIMCKCNASHANIKTRISNKSFFAHVQLILFPRTYAFRHNNINVAVYYSHWTVIFSQSVIQWGNFCTHSMVDEQVDERVSEWVHDSERMSFQCNPHHDSSSRWFSCGHTHSRAEFSPINHDTLLFAISRHPVRKYSCAVGRELCLIKSIGVRTFFSFDFRLTATDTRPLRLNVLYNIMKCSIFHFV